MLTPTGYSPPTQQPIWPTAHTAHSQHCGHTALPPGQKHKRLFSAQGEPSVDSTVRVNPLSIRDYFLRRSDPTHPHVSTSTIMGYLYSLDIYM